MFYFPYAEIIPFVDRLKKKENTSGGSDRFLGLGHEGLCYQSSLSLREMNR